jgi:hypothetical protein
MRVEGADDPVRATENVAPFGIVGGGGEDV